LDLPNIIDTQWELTEALSIAPSSNFLGLLPVIQEEKNNSSTNTINVPKEDDLPPPPPPPMIGDEGAPPPPPMMMDSMEGGPPPPPPPLNLPVFKPPVASAGGDTRNELLASIRNFSQKNLTKKKRKEKEALSVPSSSGGGGNQLMKSLFEKIQLRRRAIENKAVVVNTSNDDVVEKIEIPEKKEKPVEKSVDKNQDDWDINEKEEDDE
jgi:hypothetical protein